MTPRPKDCPHCGALHFDGTCCARPMTREEALAEARRRWPGRSVEVAHDPLLKCCVVGPDPGADGFANRAGFGPTWEAAFSDAERRERGQ